MDILGTLRQKWYGIPVYVYVISMIMGLSIYLKTRQKKNHSSDQAAADQTNSDLGSASQMSNWFWQAGIMPFMGGDIYITQTNTGTGSAYPPKGTKNGGPVRVKNPPVNVKVPKKTTAKSPATSPSPLPSTVAFKMSATSARLVKSPSSIGSLKKSGQGPTFPHKGTIYAGGS